MSWTAQMSGAEEATPEMRLAMRLGMKDGLEILGIEGQRMVQENIATPYNDKPAAVAYGNLLRGVSFNVEDTGSLLVLQIGENSVGGADKYAAPVETGTRAHMPPSSELLLWVKKKFVVEKAWQAKSIAYAISLKIAEKGTRGHEMFSRALEKLEETAVPTLEHAVAERLVAAGFAG